MVGVTSIKVQDNLDELETQSMEIADSWEFPPDVIGISPQFMPRKNSESSTDGYIICRVHCGESEKQSHQIWIFEADKLHEGPKWKLSHPELTFAFTIHTTWLSQVAPRQAKYNISVEEDFQELIAGKPKFQEFFEQENYPHFE
ncbi:MAG: carotenoid oxygenase family protein [Xenococcus sp. (in: cyanobacteria)]